MKKIFLMMVTFSLLAACTSSDKKTELEKLKKERDGLNEKIFKLEEDLAKTDSTKDKNAKVVECITLVPKTFNSYIDVQGKVDADENVSVNAEMAGTVSKINVKVGEEVKKDQVLAELDSKVFAEQVSEVQNSFELAKTMYEKQKSLWEQKIGTEVQFLQAKNQKENLEKRLATLQQQMEMSKMKSPINGIVDAVDIKLGQATMPGLAAIRVVNLCSLKVKAEVSESYLAKVKKGNDVEILLPDMQDTVKAKITYAARVISPMTRTFTVSVNLDCIKEYGPNMIAILKIVDYSNPKAFVVPVSIIQKTGSGDFVYIAENNKAKKVKVKTGKIYGGKTEVVEGLKEGDKLITAAYLDLTDGMIIKY
jgi:RND family efflux transporter MFP subunit